MQDVVEEQFNADRSWFWLNFLDENLEKAYKYYKLHEKRIPKWFYWIMWSLIILILARKTELLLFTYFGVSGNVVGQTYEYILVSVLYAAAIIELIAFFSEVVAPIRGFSIMVAMFFLVDLNSYTLYPNQLGLIPL